ncbi:hypothetical protein DSO57_1034430 [Entomophthora muscae]|uniref:Uncharacterized protein n=1 Tax=Entomophthora muscae TaxID=34485 RepID=A0ACC2REP5_9FUNG|nr:hypothetical protein DSO57_1034430 [Entomophthora muscae]
MYLTGYTEPAGHPHCGPVSALGRNSTLPDFYFGEVEPTKSPIIHEEYSKKKQELVHELNSKELLISKDKDISLAAPIALLSLDLLEPSPVNHNIRGEDSAKDDDVVLHEAEIVGLHTFQNSHLSLPEPLPPEDPGTAKPFPYPCHGNVKTQGGNVHLSVPALN